MNRSLFTSLLGFGLIVARAAHADPLSELAGFSVFGGINLTELAKGEVKTANGPALSSPRFLSTQSRAGLACKNTGSFAELGSYRSSGIENLSAFRPAGFAHNGKFFAVEGCARQLLGKGARQCDRKNVA